MLRLKCFEIRVSCQTAIHHGKILLTDAVRRHFQIIINMYLQSKYFDMVNFIGNILGLVGEAVSCGIYANSTE